MTSARCSEQTPVHGVAVPHSDYNAVTQHRCNGGGGGGCGDGVGGIVGA